jgi:1-acyl-sn-glycerol-3-phosphate acyltransferase
MKAGVPIVPVTIRGTFKMLPRTSLAPRPGRVDVIIAEPIETTEYSEKTLAALVERTRAAISGEFVEGQAEAPAT